MDGTVSGACISDPWKAQTLFSSVERACLLDILPVFRVYPTVPPGPKAERNHVYYNAETATYVDARCTREALLLGPD